MKRIVGLFTAVLIFAITAQRGYALEGTANISYSSEIMREATERGISIREIRLENSINKMINESIISQDATPLGYSNDGRYVSSNVKLIKQTTDYNCGATAALQVLYGMNCQSNVAGNNDNEKINQLMKDAETNSSDGTYVYKLKNTLNKYSRLKYMYTSCKDMDESNLKGKINDSLFYDTAPIIHADTSEIPYYNGYKTGHYIVISQLDLRNNIVRVKDCNNNGKYYGTHDITVSDVYNSIHKNGNRYLIHLNK